MSLNAPLAYCIPDVTVRVAQAAFPNGTRYMQMSDVFGPIYTNAAFAHLFPRDGQPAEDPARWDTPAREPPALGHAAWTSPTRWKLAGTRRRSLRYDLLCH
jgi:hypothetical protein